MNQKKSVMSPDDEDDDKADLRRRRILDATLACYVAYGWSGTNMSVIARHVRLTRGMIQYYFPTIDAIHHATVAHLNGEWRKKYFSYIELGSGSAVRLEDRLEIGVNALWRLMQDPLNVARQEIVSAARSNKALSAILRKEAVFDETATLELAKKSYPDLARTEARAFQRALDYTVVFLEGLSRHQFTDQAESRCQVLITMLKEQLSAYWRAHGIDVLNTPARRAAPLEDPPASTPPLTPSDRDRALALLLKAASILSVRTEEPESR